MKRITTMLAATTLLAVLIVLMQSINPGPSAPIYDA